MRSFGDFEKEGVMPGYEVFGKEEQEAINKLFEINGGILFAHGFEAIRKGVYRVREFESAFAKRVGIPYAQAVSSGSAALKVALKAMGVGKGDEVIAPAFTFVATVEAILEVEAVPVIADIDETLNLCPKSLEEAITERTKAVIPVHMMGVSADMDRIMDVAKRHNLLVLEDVAQACGGSYRGKALGTIGDMGAFSFDAGKVMITGEGGMVITSNKNFYIHARAFHDHGHEYSTTLSRGEEGALMRGFNYRMTELQAAIGLVQLSKLDMIVKSQRENKKRLKRAIRSLPFDFRKIPDPEGDIGDSVIFFLEKREQAKIFSEKMKEAGLGTKNLPDAIRWHFAKHWKHIFDEANERWKKSADLLERAIALPIMVNMSDEQISEIAEKILKIGRML
jgi:8-amino-3,8-dideoxy-alpha-D-manno-octulosonate transaminase